MEDSEGEQTPSSGVKRRHGCLTAYLIVLMTLGILGSVSYLVMSDQVLLRNDPELPASIRRPVMVVGNILMGGFAYAIWRWKRWGFWGFVASGVIMGLLKAWFSPEHRGGLVVVAAGSLLSYGVLRIGKERQGWKQLE
ncbi:MAG TPA: hypothetical protein VJV78_21865 [Polyangiales bacterium]|nr:hypothetical protein [Polyangiales bacterium]